MRAGDSYIYREGTTPNTRVAISSKVKILSFAFGQRGFTQLGVVANMDQSNTRNAEPVRGVGFGDQIAELVPQQSDPQELTFTRAMLYLANIHQVFGYAGGIDGLVRALKHHRWPFDVMQQMVISELSQHFARNDRGTQTARDGQNRALVTLYERCWLTNTGASFASDNVIVSENATAMVTDITDAMSVYDEFIPTGNARGIGTAGGEEISSGYGTNSA